ncbi:MAG: ferritin-like domain-containing protein [Pseudomonadota bacterium]|nr:ferritin-like domain-containing protein [Pseudomonadota bacterium]
MARAHWTIDELPWDRFDASKITPDLLQVVKAAAMVEYNAGDYVTYLKNVFHDDPEFCAAAEHWGVEEVQHGEALGRWAEKADPSFSFQESFAKFRAGYRIPLDAAKSVRGSRSGELIARCMVETGTSSYYTAIHEATDEPVLKAICQNIAADELRHYKLFYDHLKRYLDAEKLNRFQRVRIALSRINEAEDDELSYAYYAANGNGEPYDRQTFNRAYMRRAYSFYRPHHVDRGMAMIFKACGLKPHSVAFGAASRTAWWLMNRRVKKLEKMAA